MLNTTEITTGHLELPLYKEKRISVYVLQLDKIHPVISGNKWFKLQFYLQDAIAKNRTNIITFGGAYSNHIVAAAAACNMHGLTSTGIIRGEKPRQLSHTLVMAKEYGMNLFFTERKKYKEKIIPDDLLKDGLNNYTINEGGYGKMGVAGAATILDLCELNDITHICCAVGTGTMMAGLVNAASSFQKIIGISVLKNNQSLEKEIAALIDDQSKEKSWKLFHGFHFGGYAKQSPSLIHFMNELYAATGVPTDFVYTAKLFYSVNDLAAKDFFPSGSHILIIHSGGLQGNDSLPKGTLIF
jgi:1-aminocyclopropane-1-carboxylate deaminase